MTDLDLVAAYSLWMRDRRLSDETVRARTGALGRFALSQGVDPGTATAEEVQAHVALRRASLSVDSLRTELANLSAFYSWCVRFGHRADDPMLRVVVPRREGADVRPIPDDALAGALDSALSGDAALLALAAFAGLRAMEVAALDWRDVDLRGGVLTVRRGKGGKRRRVDIGPNLARVLQELPHRIGPVVRRRDGAPGPCTANMVTKRASSILGGRATGYTLHQLRHRFATVAYQADKDLRAVQDLLGHSSPTVTAIYADPGRDAARAAVHAADKLNRG